MQFWNFVHNSTPFHVYEFLAVIMLAVMVVLLAVHMLKDQSRQDDRNDEDSKGGKSK